MVKFLHTSGTSVMSTLQCTHGKRWFIIGYTDLFTRLFNNRATFRVFKIERKLYEKEDLGFLESMFQKLLLNFTWWVNRKDAERLNVFEGGFLGLDNIGAFNRSEPLPTGGVLRQADGTAWMAFYCLNM